MHVTIRGKNPNISHKEIKYALNWCMEQFISKRLSANISTRIDLKVINDRFLYDDFEELATIEPEENYWEPPYRKFIITVKAPKCTRECLLEVLFHECVHIKQYAVGELHDLAGNDMVRFRKRRYKNKTECYKSYKNLPWEKEAFALEKILFYNYTFHLNQTGKQFD